MAGIKRKHTDMEELNKPQLIAKIRSINDERDKALAALIYLSGARISELLGTKKYIKHYKGSGKERYLERTEEVIIEPLKKENVEVLLDKDTLLIHQVSCLKRKKEIPKRTIPIIISKEQELVDVFLQYYYTVKPTEPLFNITRQRAWQIINKELQLYNHFLIHERVTHLVTNSDFTDLHLKQFRGWSDTRPASIYTHLKWQDLANKMMSKPQIPQ